MDRKNKRAVQHGFPLPQMTAEPQKKEMEISKPLNMSGLAPPFIVDPTLVDQAAAWTMSEPMAPARSRDGDFMFGVPDDLAMRESAMPIFGTSPTTRRSGPMRLGPDASLLSGSPGSRAFGTSPFSQGGHVFFSGSQGSDADAAVYGQQQLQKRAHFRPDEEEGMDEADFLPSSLSDLLTPEELERRQRASRGAQSLPASAGLEKTFWPSDMHNAGLREDAQFNDQETLLQLPTSTAAPGRTSIGFGVESGSSFVQNVNPLLQSYSRASRAALGQHAPGQSLPRGLAAGLSRLHYQRPEESAAAQPIPGIQAAPLSRNLDDLAPIAPSSVLPHRHALYPGDKVSPRNSGLVFGTSPYSAALQRQNSTGVPIPPTQGTPGNAPMPQMSPSKSAVNRLRAESIKGAPARAPGSPLATPAISAGEDDEETIFQLE